jgi:hypothetical protein
MAGKSQDQTEQQMAAESPYRSAETKDGSVVWMRNSGAGSAATKKLSRGMLPGAQRLG